jgi:hypothetical protein
VSPVAMSLLLLAGFGVFAVSAYRRWCLLAVATPAARFDRIGRRLAATWRYAFAQERMRRYWWAGVAHLAIFSGFVVLLLRSLILWGRGYSEGFDFWLFGLDQPLGKIYALLKDIFVVLVILGTLVFVVLSRGAQADPNDAEHRGADHPGHHPHHDGVRRALRRGEPRPRRAGNRCGGAFQSVGTGGLGRRLGAVPVGAFRRRDQRAAPFGLLDPRGAGVGFSQYSALLQALPHHYRHPQRVLSRISTRPGDWPRPKISKARSNARKPWASPASSSSVGRRCSTFSPAPNAAGVPTSALPPIPASCSHRNSSPSTCAIICIPARTSSSRPDATVIPGLPRQSRKVTRSDGCRWIDQRARHRAGRAGACDHQPRGALGLHHLSRLRAGMPGVHQLCG